MHITQSYLTNSSCYKKNAARDDSRYRIFQDRGPRGIMLHSVGCPQPDPAVFVRTWNCDYSACVHAFVGADEVYQTLPWSFRGWHCGGDANNTHIGVEMTEPGCIQYIAGSNFSCSDFPAARAHATAAYQNAVQLFAMLCEQYSLDPLGDGVILSHAEGHKRGVASNHGDPEHLWTQLGLPYTMDGFRKDVKRTVEKSKLDNVPALWAEEAVAWAVKGGIISGDEHGDLMLRSPLTREQFCVMLKRYHDSIR